MMNCVASFGMFGMGDKCGCAYLVGWMDGWSFGVRVKSVSLWFGRRRLVAYVQSMGWKRWLGFVALTMDYGLLVEHGTLNSDRSI